MDEGAGPLRPQAPRTLLTSVTNEDGAEDGRPRCRHRATKVRLKKSFNKSILTCPKRWKVKNKWRVQTISSTRADNRLTEYKLSIGATL